MSRANSGTAKAYAIASQACTFPATHSKLRTIRAKVFDHITEGSHCFMAEHDELLGNTYRPQMEAHMPVTTIPGGHRLSDEALPVTTIPGGHRLSDEALPIIKDVLMHKQETLQTVSK